MIKEIEYKNLNDLKSKVSLDAKNDNPEGTIAYKISATLMNELLKKYKKGGKK